MEIIFYTRTTSGMWMLSYNGNTERYIFYTFKDALKKFKEKYNLKYKRNIKLVKNDFCGTYGFMY